MVSLSFIMRVCLIHNQFNRSGGMESYLLALVRGFLDQGDQVHLRVYQVDRALASRYPVSLDHQRLFWVPSPWRKYVFLHSLNTRFDRSQYDLSLCLTRTGGTDVAICGGIHPAALARRKRPAPGRWLHDRLEIHFEKVMLSGVSWVVAHSRLLAKEIDTYYQINPEKIEVLYPPVDTERFYVAPSEQIREARARFQIDTDCLTLLFPSLGHRRKGLAELLAAFRQLPARKYRLLVAGEKLGGDVPDNVRYIGYVEDMASLYSGVDYTILPSHYEPFGLAVVESLQCGTPVVVSKRVGAAELLDAECGMILPDNRSATLTTAISRLKRRRVRPHFAERTGLTLQDHISSLKRLVSGCHAIK